MLNPVAIYNVRRATCNSHLVEGILNLTKLDEMPEVQRLAEKTVKNIIGNSIVKRRRLTSREVNAIIARHAEMLNKEPSDGSQN